MDEKYPGQDRRYEPIRNTKPRTIQIVIRNGRIAPIETVTIDIDKREEVRWTCAQGELGIRFAANQSPFSGFNFRAGRGGACISGIPVRGKEGRMYRYTVLVTTPDAVLITQTPSVAVISQAKPVVDKRTGCLGIFAALFLKLFGKL